MDASLEEKLRKTPQQSGVYIFKDESAKVLYVGKAKSLRNRLRSYFQSGAERTLDERKQGMVRRVRDFSYVVTDSELEALILEANLIKQYKPPFNVVLRDDKNYPYLKLTINEPWPRLEVVRRTLRDGALYFGPFIPASAMWETLAFVRRHFGLRPCRYRLDKKMRPCIQHQMGRCPAPCGGSLSQEEYAKTVNQVRLFLEGKKQGLLKELEAKMKKLAEEELYEDAARLRDRIEALKRALEQQKVVQPGFGDIDVIGYAAEGARLAFQMFFIRRGLMIGVKDFYLPHYAPDGEKTHMPAGELLAGFMETFYAKEIIPAAEVLVAAKPDDSAALEAWLSGKRQGRVKIIVPRRGKKEDLLRMAERNAAEVLRAKAASPEQKTLETLKERLHLKKAPASIGAFDISTTQGAQPVGGFIYWADGEFRKDLYRHVKIKTVPGGKMDDYAMMEETVSRVLPGLADAAPELVIIDGGKGQLEAAMRAVYGLALQPASGVVAVAKDPDRVFTTRAELPVNIEDGSPSSLLLKRIRDEVHRFSIGFHKRLRGKSMLSSPLESVKGIGRQKRFELLRHFGSLEAIRQADEQEIASVPGIGPELARVIKNTLSPNKNMLE